MSREGMTSKTQLNATNFRILLSVSLLLIIAISSAGFAYAHQLLSTYADEIAHKKVDATASNSTIASLQKIQQTMKENQGLISKIDKLRADSSFPEFMIVDQIKTIAKRNDIRLSGYSFGSASSNEVAPAAGGQPQPPITGQAATNSGDTVSLTINFSSVPSYRKYLQFLSDIEQNVPKMRITGVGVGATGGSSNTDSPPAASGDNQQPTANTGAVSVDPLVVEMYIK